MNISVVIPVYNRPSLLLRALKSVYSQTLQPYEIIVVDDGSKDDLSAALNKQYPDVKLVKQSHAGVSRARNNGLKHVKGDWVAFLDSDDEWLPDKLEEQTNTLKKSQHLLCHTDEIWIRNGVRVNPHLKHQKYGGDIFKQCLLICLISPSSALIKKDLLDNIGGFDENLPACEDYDLWLNITSQYTVEYVDKPLIIKHGGHEDQLSRKHWGMDRFRIYSMEKLHENSILSNKQSIELLQELIRKCSIFSKGAYKHQQFDSYQQYFEKVIKYKSLLNAMS